MQTEAATFGRRTQPHRIIVARGEKVRAMTLSPWGAWAAGGGLCVVLLWLIGATAYILFHDDIYEAARGHRITVEHAYEDRIARLRRQIDEINTRQYLDQRAFEARLETLLRRQAEIEERTQKISALVDEARRRNVTVRLDPTRAGGPVGGDLQLASPYVSAFRMARPAPLDAPAVQRPVAPAGPAGTTVEEIESSIGRVESAQGHAIAALETTIDDINGRLEEVVGAIGARVPAAAARSGTGGPLVELRRIEGPGIEVGDRSLERIQAGFDRLDLLRFQVSRLPVRIPIDGAVEITSDYGTRLDPFLKRPALHTGIDFRGDAGDPVRAAAGGTVTVAEYSGGYGNMVEIDHGNGYSTRYGHMSALLVRAGDNIAPGDILGRVGSTGRSTGPHLHYETRLRGVVRDPSPYIEAAELLPPGF